MSASPPSSTSSLPGMVRPGSSLRQLAFKALGTQCIVQYACDAPGQAAGFERSALAWVQAFEARYSRFKPDSLVSQINAAAGHHWVEVDDEMEQLLNLCDTLHVMTRGVLDPTALPLIRLWDYKAKDPVIPAPEQISAARELVGWSKVRRVPGRVFLPQPGMALDFGGFGKEYAVDIVAQLAVNHGIPDVLVDFGHDLRALGHPPDRPCWHVGLEDPKRPGQTAGSIGVTGKGVASSGDYLRCFVINGRRYGHIIDPRTGWPVANGCSQTTVIADTCLQAGVLSTTAFLLGVNEGINYIHGFPGAEGLMCTGSARAQTRGFFKYVATS